MTQMRDRIRSWWRGNDRESDACDSSCVDRQGCDGDQRQFGFPELLEVLSHAEDEFTAIRHRPADGGVFRTGRTRRSPAFLTLEGKLKQIRRHCVAILNEIHGVEFDDDCREILSDTLRRFIGMVDRLQAGLTPVSADRINFPPSHARQAPPDLHQPVGLRSAHRTGAHADGTRSCPDRLSGHGVQPLWAIERTAGHRREVRAFR